MNGYSTEYDDALFEDYESGEPENDEAARGRFRPSKPKMAKGDNLYKARPTSNYVTQTQLETSLARVGGQIKTNADATQAVNSRVNSIGVRLDAEAAKRKKDHEAIRKQVQSSNQMAILPLLLQTPPQIAVKDSVTGAPAVLQSTPGHPVTITGTSSSNTLLPLILLMGMGGMGGMGGDSKGSDDNSMMMMMMVLLMSQPSK